MKDAPVVMVSSTARDLPAYRAQVMDACHRSDMVPRMMEHLPAMAADAIKASLDLVDQADVYVGVFAQRYGYVPEGQDISITQMEYERAIERGIPRLIFLMHEDVPVTVADIDWANKPMLDKLKQRLKQEQVVAFFRNPDDLRALVLQSLSALQNQLDDARTDAEGQPTAASLAKSLHYFTEIPKPPEPYIAHPYTLLQVRSLVGRKAELEMLTDWGTGKEPYAEVRIFNVVAIGGMGKSALTWTWFNDIAPQEMAPIAGRVWWSFYESDATFENFVTRVLAYVSRRPLEEVHKLSVAEREDQLLRILDREPFLLVLDGLERILTAYARLDAAYLRDDEALDKKTANRTGNALSVPASESWASGKHVLRMAADPRAGRFLRALTRIRASRVLVSTRLYPADLQAPGGTPSPNCFALFLTGLSDQDALELWRDYGARGSPEAMLPVFRTFDKHPLLLQLLAYEVAEFREAPGDFDAWRTANRDFNPFGLELANVQSHVLLHALHALSPQEVRTLNVIAGFRMPVSMNTLKALLIFDNDEDPAQQPFKTLGELDRVLTVLEDRGLLGWDRRANRYDLHPVVRGTVWSSLAKPIKQRIYEQIVDHYSSQQTVDWIDVQTIQQLEPYIQIYRSLIGLGRTVEADRLLQGQIDRFREAFVVLRGDDNA